MHDNESVVVFFPIKKLLGFPLGAQLQSFSELGSEFSVKNKLLLTDTRLLLERMSRLSLT